MVKQKFSFESSCCCIEIFTNYTLSGRIGKVVSSVAAVALIDTTHVALRGYCPCGCEVRPVNWI